MNGTTYPTMSGTTYPIFSFFIKLVSLSYWCRQVEWNRPWWKTTITTIICFLCIEENLYNKFTRNSQTYFLEIQLEGENLDFCAEKICLREIPAATYININWFQLLNNGWHHLTEKANQEACRGDGSTCPVAQLTPASPPSWHGARPQHHSASLPIIKILFQIKYLFHSGHRILAINFCNL